MDVLIYINKKITKLQIAELKSCKQLEVAIYCKKMYPLADNGPRFPCLHCCNLVNSPPKMNISNRPLESAQSARFACRHIVPYGGQTGTFWLNAHIILLQMANRYHRNINSRYQNFKCACYSISITEMCSYPIYLINTKHIIHFQKAFYWERL